MSTNDVPGANPSNGDVLKMGCWAEHEDGSLIFVKSTEGGRVIYEMFDRSRDPIIVFNDAMLEDIFKTKFTYDPNNPKGDKWKWHDKTPFPWNNVIKAGARDGLTYASASDQLVAAVRVALSLGLVGKDFDPKSISHLTDQMVPGGALAIINKLQAAIDGLPDKLAKVIDVKNAESTQNRGLIKRIFGKK